MDNFEMGPVGTPADTDAGLQTYLENLAAARQQEAGLQMMQNAIAAGAGTAPTSTKGLMSGTPQAELENYLAQKEADRKMAIVKANQKQGGDAKKFGKTNLIDPATGSAVSYDETTGTYGYAGKDGWTQVAAPIERLKRSAGSGAGKGKKEKISAGQQKKADALVIGEEAAKQYEKAIKETNYDPTSYSNILDQMDMPTMLKFLQSDTGKTIKSAEGAWVEAYLRDASGAAIPESERGSYAEKYFPRVSDSAEAVANKKRLRKLKEMSFVESAGPAAVDTSALAEEAAATAPRKPEPGLLERLFGGASEEPVAAKEPKLSAEDQAALDWAKKNPEDPRAAQILKSLGM